MPNHAERKCNNMVDIDSRRYRFPNRVPYRCNSAGIVTARVPWKMQFRMWLGLPCRRCGSSFWLFSCRYETCGSRRRPAVCDWFVDRFPLIFGAFLLGVFALIGWGLLFDTLHPCKAYGKPYYHAPVYIQSGGGKYGGGVMIPTGGGVYPDCEKR